MSAADPEERLRALLLANQHLTSELGLREVLQRVVETAVQLVRARYGALGVLAADGDGLADFVHVGMPADRAALIGELPRGRGLLGTLIKDPRPLRVDDIAGHPLSSGFPAHHPPMKSFLGVPIRVRDEVFGNLYLTDHDDGAFTAADQEVAEALAATAGVAIANARLYEETRYRAQWAAALSEVAREVTTVEGDPVELLVRTAADLAETDTVAVLQVEDQGASLAITHAHGAHAPAVGRRLAARGSLVEEAIAVGRPMLSNEAPGRLATALPGFEEPGHTVVAPFVAHLGVRGALVLSRRRGRAPLMPRDVEMAGSFAAHVGVVLGQERLRAAQERSSLLEDRSRIARDLHDHVIQRIYAVGLRLSAVAQAVPPDQSARVESQVDELDATIRQIRQAIFSLQSGTGDTARARLARLLDEVAGFEAAPELFVQGPLDTVADPDLVVDMVAVVREALSNAVRHGRSRRAVVSVAASSEGVEVEVADDGSGLHEVASTGGLSNLRERARRRGGTLEVENAVSGGVVLRWSVPLGRSPRGGGSRE